MLVSNPTHAQVNIKGRVIYRKDARPAPRASVSLLRKDRGSLTDESGNFSLHLPVTRNNDTLVISSIGYENIIIPLRDALKKKVFELVEFSKNLAPVTVKSFNSQDVVGATNELVGYFRSWNTDSTGGEVGRIFKLPYNEYKIDKIRFKVSNMCRACLIRLHIRNVIAGAPAEELLSDSISLNVKKLTVEDKAPEFDLSKYDQVFNKPKLFIGLEVIGCTKNDSTACSFCFVGTEPGIYTYKSTKTGPWDETDNFAIYIKMFLRF